MDLNADLGEGFGVWRLGDDEALLELVTSANVACGFHAGDAVTMRRVCDWAADRGVAVGAQVGYRDLAGLRPPRASTYDLAELRDEIIYQIAALDGFCRLQGERVPLRQAARRALQRGRGDVWQAVGDRGGHRRLRPHAAGAVPARLDAGPCAAGAGLRVVAEGFADRAYQPRRHAGAARPAGRADVRCGRSWPRGRCGWPGRAEVEAAGRHGRRVPGRVALPARRHPRRGRAGPAGPAKPCMTPASPPGAVRLADHDPGSWSALPPAFMIARDHGGVQAAQDQGEPGGAGRESTMIGTPQSWRVRWQAACSASASQVAAWATTCSTPPSTSAR